ncbi:MAG: hypothetical protein HY319_18920 [Armatimonadetes bacterium]|nr:hypothetical protein [Armatimonadota bacterium]
MRYPMTACLLMLCLLAPALAGEPARVDLDSDVPFCLNGLELGMSSQELARLMGPPVRRLNEDMSLYRDNLLVRLREEKVVNLGASGSVWTLSQGSEGVASAGMTLEELEQRLGPPNARYGRPDQNRLAVRIYRASRSDVGIMVMQDQVVGFLLSEPGMMELTLKERGYVELSEPR